MQIPRRKSEELRRRDEGPLYITEDGLKRLQEKLARLKRALPDFIIETEQAAAYGDRSENDEYKEAKSNLRRTHRRILTIEDQIKRVVIINPLLNVSGTIQLGSTVVLESGKTRKIFQILGSHEVDPDKGRISYKSLLGAALMNHIKGDIITIQTKSGSQEYRIIEIR